MTLVPILLSVVILTLTFLVTFAGIQVFHILHEFRLSLKKLNKILDNTQTLSDSAARPVTAVNAFFSEVKQLVNQTQDEIIVSSSDRVIESVSQSPTPQSKPHRTFFRRSGLPLRPS
jgi:hypothetical protein